MARRSFKITPKMLAAGVEVLRGYDAFFDLGPGLEELLVEELTEAVGRAASEADIPASLAVEQSSEPAMNPTEKEEVRTALDALALALTEHDHLWSDELRSLYERAIAATKA